MRDRLEAAGLAAAAALVHALPSGSARALGRSLGKGAHGLGIRRRVARENLQRALGDTVDATALARIERDAFAHLGESFIEFLSMRDAPAARLAARVDVTGEEHLRAALDAGRGAIVASGHFGNWEIMGASLAARGYPVTFIVQELRNPHADALVDGIRRGAGIEVLPRGMALRRVDDALQRNRLVFFMCDQDARRRGLFVDFFGVPASTPKGAAQIARRRGVPMLTALGRRDRDGRHHLTIGAALAVPAGDEETAIHGLLVQFNARLEAAIRSAPEQYWWAHRRWKTRPAGAAAAAVATGTAARR